jgi:hypothetical protein
MMAVASADELTINTVSIGVESLWCPRRGHTKAVISPRLPTPDGFRGYASIFLMSRLSTPIPKAPQDERRTYSEMSPSLQQRTRNR